MSLSSAADPRLHACLSACPSLTATACLDLVSICLHAFLFPADLACLPFLFLAYMLPCRLLPQLLHLSHLRSSCVGRVILLLLLCCSLSICVMILPSIFVMVDCFVSASVCSFFPHCCCKIPLLLVGVVALRSVFADVKIPLFLVAL